MYYQQRRPGPGGMPRGQPMMMPRGPFQQRGMPGPMRGNNVPRRPGPFVPRGMAVPHMPMRGAPIAQRGVPFVPQFQQPRYGVHAVAEAFFPLLTAERKLPELCKRYPKLYYSQDLTQEIVHWVQDNKLEGKIPLDVCTNFSFDGEATVTAPKHFTRSKEEEKADAEASEANTEDTYSARVMLLSPAIPEKAEEPKEGEPKKPAKPVPHLMQQIKFVVSTTASGVAVPLGGDWVKADGADPTKDATLIKTAIRHCKAQCGLDLTPCKKWVRFVEVQYRRQSGAMHHSVVFIPDVWTAFASKDKKTELCKATMMEEKEVEEDEEVEVEEETPAEGAPAPAEGEAAEPAKKKTKIVKKKVIKEVAKVVLKPTEMTLAALIDHNTFDTSEATVEASLFALAFDEMLSYSHAKSILTILRKKKRESDDQSSVLKRKREEEAAERKVQLDKQREEVEAKRKKMEEEHKEREAEKARREEEEKDMSDEEKAKRREEDKEKADAARKALEEEFKAKREAEQKKRLDDIQKAKDDAAAAKAQQDEEDRARGYKIVKSTLTHIDEAIAQPFQYFDRPLGTSGQIRRDIIEGIMHALGELTQREVDGLLRCIGLPPDRAGSPLFYRRLASYTTTEEKQVELPPVVEEKSAEAAAAPGEETMQETPAAEE